VKVASEPEALIQGPKSTYHFKRVGLEVLSQWLYSAFAEAGPATIRVEPAHAGSVERPNQ
jgi:hypothetical protein